MLRKIRIVLAAVVFVCISLLFLDFTGAWSPKLSFFASIQALEAVLALNLLVIIALVLVTLLFGRVYCSVICPLGILQDIISAPGSRKHRNRFSYKKELPIVRYGILGVFILLIILGFTSIAALIAPYGAFGRIMSELFAPLYGWCNNLLAAISEHSGSVTFYPVQVAVRSLPTLIVAAVSFVVIFAFARIGGRLWCNTVCPVGTVLGLLSRFAIFKPVINQSKCISCGICARGCKSSCINPKEHSIDYSRCVMCMDCIDNCTHGAISIAAAPCKSCKTRPEPAANDEAGDSSADGGRRAFITGALLAAGAVTLKAQKKDADGGLAALQDKKKPRREVPLKPAGAQSLRHFSSSCVACQLCVTECPFGVLSPSTSLDTLMQPEMNFEKGFCRTSCNRCSQVCPAGAIKPVTVEEKTSIRIGHAVVIPDNCLPASQGQSCGNCSRHCPTGAITMVDGPMDKKIPAVNTELCIGCGSCEYHCPARPYPAIYVEGHLIHNQI